MSGKKFVLECKDPVPSDIEVSQAITPVPITQIAAEAGIKPEELEPYGHYKAKVRHPPKSSPLTWPEVLLLTP